MKEKTLLVAGLVISIFLIGSISAKAAPNNILGTNLIPHLKNLENNLTPHREFTFPNKQVGNCHFDSEKMLLYPDGRGVFQGSLLVYDLQNIWHWNIKGLTFTDSSGNRLLTLHDFQSPKFGPHKTPWTFEFGFVNALYDKVHNISFGNTCTHEYPL
jgi:hypothetical protein